MSSEFWRDVCSRDSNESYACCGVDRPGRGGAISQCVEGCVAHGW